MIVAFYPAAGFPRIRGRTPGAKNGTRNTGDERTESRQQTAVYFRAARDGHS